MIIIKKLIKAFNNLNNRINRHNGKQIHIIN